MKQFDLKTVVNFPNVKLADDMGKVKLQGSMMLAVAWRVWSGWFRVDEAG
jgi:hypothetical protein